MVSSKSLFTYENFTHAIAGATGSVVGMAVFYPLDTVRCRLQLEDDPKFRGSAWEILTTLANDEGLKSLYKGMIPVLQSLCASNFVYFYTFHGLRSYHNGGSRSAIQDLLLGVLAGCINVMVTTPLWVVNTRLKHGKTPYGSLLGGLREITRREGFLSLWAGAVPSLLLVSNPAIQFMVYESTKRHFQRSGNFSAPTAFLVGALAKAVATCTTYPLQLVQARLRAGLSLKPLAREVKKDPAALFRGLEAKLLQTILTAALMFAAYEKIARFVLSILKRKISR